MTVLDERGRLTPPRNRPLWRRIIRSARLPPQIGRWLKRRMPRRLFPRSLLIIVLPVLILESVVAFVFMDRHWSNVTRRLSEGTASDIATIAQLIENEPSLAGKERIAEVARTELFTQARLLPSNQLPPPAPKPFFSLLDRELSRAIGARVQRPFWIDTVGNSRFVEIRVKLRDSTLQIIYRRSQTYASNSHITLVWMAGTSLVLIGVAILFLHNQVRPIQRLAEAAERFGQGRPVDNYRPYGALEVRQAAWAFIEMKRRIERQIEQRTVMLAGVSHDLRTMLTRFRLEVELLQPSPGTQDLKRDVVAMQAMLEDYLAFAKTDVDEHVDSVDLAAMLADVAAEGRASGIAVAVRYSSERIVSVRPNAVRRMLSNIVLNATHYGSAIEITGRTTSDWVTIAIDDNGPGIAPALREDAFKPFFRIDSARNQTIEGTGLGLTIARDIARGHGGDIRLGEAPAGGLRAEIRLPL